MSGATQLLRLAADGSRMLVRYQRARGLRGGGCRKHTYYEINHSVNDPRLSEREDEVLGGQSSN